jgi:hypothetical protein
MQAELALELGEGVVDLLAINEVGHDSGIDDAVAGNSIPLLADTPEANAWGTWDADWRDLVIVDEDNLQTDRISLTDFDLEEIATYEAVKAMLLEAL